VRQDLIPVTQAAGPDWFSRCGIAPASEERARLAERRSLTIAYVATWAEAVRILAQGDLDARHWDRQEAEREALWLSVAETLGEDALLECLTNLYEKNEGPLADAVRAAAVRLAIDGGHFAAEAVGAAKLALQHAALASLAGAAPDHSFGVNLAIFAGGRWPLLERYGTLLVF
jgi:hypothetical protein